MEQQKAKHAPPPRPVQLKKSVWNSSTNQIVHSKDANQDQSRFICWILKDSFPRLFSELEFKGNPHDQSELAIYQRTIGGRIPGSWDFFGYTKSQHEQRKCILMYYHPNVSFINQEPKRRQRLYNILDLAGKPRTKIPKLMSYLFGHFDIFAMKNVRIEEIPDIERNGYVFTDGCGEMSSEIAQEFFGHYKKEVWEGRDVYIPSIIQIRLPGVKGVLVLNDKLEGRVIRVGPSMQKLKLWHLVAPDTYPVVPSLPSCILGCSLPTFSFHRLDGQALMLLIQRGIDPGVIRKRTKEYIDSVRYATIDLLHGLNFLFITRNSEYKLCLEMIQEYIHGDFRDGKLLLSVWEKIHTFQRKEVDGWKKKTDGNTDFKIRLPCQSALLYGGCDSEGHLMPGQTFVAVTINNVRTVIKGKVAVYRNPCYHPSDILVLDAVEIPTSLSDVILFPVTGGRPHQDESSGGDLDGDKFTVIWDEMLIPTTKLPSFDYLPKSMISLIHEYADSKGIPRVSEQSNLKKLMGHRMNDKEFLVKELTKPFKSLMPRIDSLIRKWRKHLNDDPVMDSLLNALFCCTVDNEDDLPDMDRLLKTLETEINLLSKELSPFNAEHDYFLFEMTECEKHTQRYHNKGMRQEMFRITLMDAANELKTLDPNICTYFKTSVIEEISLAQRVVSHFTKQLDNMNHAGKLTKETELLAKQIGAKFSSNLENQFRQTVHDFLEEIKAISPDEIRKAALELGNLKEAEQFCTKEINKKVKNIQELIREGAKTQNRLDQFAESTKRILEAFDRKVEKEIHTVHTTIEILSSLIDLELQFLQQSKRLPIYDYRPKLLKQLSDSSIAMIIAGTGSGKSTCVPHYVLNDMIIDGRATTIRRICVAQPRRKATVALAEFMSSTRKSTLGNTVGYHIGRERANTRKNYTLIECMTFGVLLGKSMTDPAFSEYSVLFVDEVHENSPDLYLLFGTIHQAMILNPQLKVVLMSATIDPKPLLSYFGNMELCHVAVETPFPITVEYRNCAKEKAIEQALEEVLKIHKNNDIDDHPDILVFLPLVKNIVVACQKLAKVGQGNLIPLPFYSMLPKEEKQKVTDRSLCGQGLFRRVIFSTNIAETSLTLPELGFVVDSGLQLHVRKDPNTEIITRITGRCSKSAAVQRRGRIGRTAPGTCICLYSNFEFAMEFDNQQNITYHDLAFPILGMIKNKISVDKFHWYQRPSDLDLTETFLVLEELGMVTKPIANPSASFRESRDFTLTKYGELALNLRGTGLTIRQVRFLFEAVRYGIFREAIVILSFMVSGIDPNKKDDNDDEDIEEEDSEDSDSDSDVSEAEFPFEEQFEHYKWYKNPDSALETLLYYYNEWLKDNKHEAFKGSGMKKFKRAKKDLQASVYRHEMLKHLNYNPDVYEQSEDPIGKCLQVSYFSNIGCVTLSSFNRANSERNSAMKLINYAIAEYGIISNSEEKRYGFKNYMLLKIQGKLEGEQQIDSASEYDPDEYKPPETLRLVDFIKPTEKEKFKVMQVRHDQIPSRLKAIGIDSTTSPKKTASALLASNSSKNGSSLNPALKQHQDPPPIIAASLFPDYESPSSRKSRKKKTDNKSVDVPEDTEEGNEKIVERAHALLQEGFTELEAWRVANEELGKDRPFFPKKLRRALKDLRAQDTKKSEILNTVVDNLTELPWYKKKPVYPSERYNMMEGIARQFSQKSSEIDAWCKALFRVRKWEDAGRITFDHNDPDIYPTDWDTQQKGNISEAEEDDRVIVENNSITNNDGLAKYVKYFTSQLVNEGYSETDAHLLALQMVEELQQQGDQFEDLKDEVEAMTLSSDDISQQFANLLNGPSVNISRRANEEEEVPSSVGELGTGGYFVDQIDKNWLKNLEELNSTKLSTKGSSKRPDYSNPPQLAKILLRDNDDEGKRGVYTPSEIVRPDAFIEQLQADEVEMYSILKTKTRKEKIRIKPDGKIPPLPHLYFYMTCTKFGKTHFLSHLHRVRIPLELPARWQILLDVLKEKCAGESHLFDTQEPDFDDKVIETVRPTESHCIVS